MKETLKQAGYQYYKYTGGITKQHLIKNLHTGRIEVFVANKNHASWGLIYKNTHLEFCGSVN